MHTHVFHIISCRCFIFLGCKSCQPLMVYIKTQRINTSHKNIYSHIKFKPLNQVRPMHISLDYTMGILIDLFQFSGQKYTFSLRKGFWFNDKSPRFSFLFRLKISFQLMILNRKHPCHWKESIVLSKLFPHFHKISSHQILSSEVKHPWEMIYFLIGLHSA